MPSLIDNFMIWNSRYLWPHGGDEWSAPWGSPQAQWESTVVPRLEGLLPSRTILEIAPGYGRWSQFLSTRCEHLIVVDLSPNCIKACRERFIGQKHIMFLVNDGFTFPSVDGDSVDLVFSFDSLVHAEPDVISSYVKECSRVLRKSGCGFIHHSNLGQYEPDLPVRPNDDEHLRSRKMSAAIFSRCCEDARMMCVKQEKINWLDTGRLLDCFSWFKHSISGEQPSPPISNWTFMEEARSAKGLRRP